MNAQQEEIRRQVRRICVDTGLPLTTLAKLAGVSPSTLTRFMHRPVRHVLSTSTMSKLKLAVAQIHPPPTGLSARITNEHHEYVQMSAIGRRMQQARQAIAPEHPDAIIAGFFGWSTLEMDMIFAGHVEPKLSDFHAFTKRMRVTADFLLSGDLERLPRRSELALLAKFPELAKYPEPDGSVSPPADPGDTEPHTDTVPGVRRIDQYR